MKKEDILNFISKFTKFNEKAITECFTLGNCFWFALILKERFCGKIYYMPVDNHFVTKIDDNYYDITGEVKPTPSIYLWEEYMKSEPLDSRRVIGDCIV